MHLFIRTVFKILKGILKVPAVLVSAVIVYLLVAIVLSAIPVNNRKTGMGEVEVYILSNGVHSDLVLPIKNQYKDWSTEVKFEHILAADTTFRHLAFGWGDRAFYLETPTWADLKFKTAFNALFGLGNSAIHATFFYRMTESKSCIKLNLTSDQYLKLVNYIESSFHKPDGKPQNIDTNGSYGPIDAFYEAKGRYNLFKTCNTWTNNGLKAAGQRACLWTPFDKGIFWQYR